MEKIMSMMTGIDDLIREVSNTKDKNTPYESKEVQEIKLWWDGQVYPNIDIAYDSNEISFQFLEKLSSVVREYGYKIHDQCRPNYTDFRSVQTPKHLIPISCSNSIDCPISGFDKCRINIR